MELAAWCCCLVCMLLLVVCHSCLHACSCNMVVHCLHSCPSLAANVHQCTPEQQAATSSTKHCQYTEKQAANVAVLF